MIKRIFKFKNEVTEGWTDDGVKAYDTLIVALGHAIACFAGWLLLNVTDFSFINFLAVLGIGFGGIGAVALTSYSIYHGISHFILISPENKKTSRQIQIVTLITLLPLFYFIDSNTMWDVVRKSFFSLPLLAIHFVIGYVAYFFAKDMGTTTPIKPYLIGFIISLAMGLFNYHDHGLGEDEESFHNEKIIALKAEIRELTQNLPPMTPEAELRELLEGRRPHMTPPISRTQQEIIKREKNIRQIRIERDKTGGFFKYIHFIIFIYFGILLGTIKRFNTISQARKFLADYREKTQDDQ